LLFAGGIAGFGAWIPALPQDVIKSRIQSSPKAMPMATAYRQLMREGGYRAFWRGLGPVLLRAFPANSVTFLFYVRWLISIWIG
jgi:solute carrier family 25 carnitine/acylcarnitine transporter 20/29